MPSWKIDGEHRNDYRYRNPRIRNSDDAFPQAMASEAQHPDHEPNYRPVRRMATGLRHPHAYRRKSGKIYRTPINVFRTVDGFIIALTYSSQSEWVKNVLASGSCELRTVGRKYRLSDPKVVHDPTRWRFPFLVRLVLGLVGADEYMELSKSPSAVPS
jgi:hypothetical protein